VTHFTISQLANHAQVTVETVRYYERRGLLPKPPRRAAGYRQYSQDHLAYLEFIRRAQALGFSLKEIAELLALRADPRMRCHDVRAQAAHKLADVDAKIRALEHIRGVLERLIAECPGEGPLSACPILDALTAPDPRGGETPP
jgi:MerR family transcriptional regulator, copper efflux regulator